MSGPMPESGSKIVKAFPKLERKAKNHGTTFTEEVRRWLLEAKRKENRLALKAELKSVQKRLASFAGGRPDDPERMGLAKRSLGRLEAEIMAQLAKDDPEPVKELLARMEREYQEEVERQIGGDYWNRLK